MNEFPSKWGAPWWREWVQHRQPLYALQIWNEETTEEPWPHELTTSGFAKYHIHLSDISALTHFSVQLLHFALLWTAEVFFKYQRSIPHGSPGLSAQKGISMHSLHGRASGRDAQRFVRWRLGLNHREKHVQNSGVWPRGARVFGPDDSAAAESICSLATGKM